MSKLTGIEGTIDDSDATASSRDTRGDRRQRHAMAIIAAGPAPAPSPRSAAPPTKAARNPISEPSA